MKRFRLVLLVAALLLTVAGMAAAKEMTGVVTAVDIDKSILTLKSESMVVSVDCETGSLLTGIKAGDEVTIQYKEEGGKKRATGVTRVAPKDGKPGSGY